jgi:glycosyltransferase involved in cell wall biosynthesis
MQRVAIQMATEYGNLCTHVIAPSQSIADILGQRQVTTPISAIPTGIDLELYGSGDGAAFRRQYGIPDDALVVGHVGRLASEKNLDYLARAVGSFLASRPEAVWVVVGSGEEEETIRETVANLADADRIVMAGKRTGRALADAYGAMDVFAFSSQSETQGMVLAEAMAARTPVVALDAPGVRDVLSDANGRRLAADAPEEAFAAALDELSQDRGALRELGEAARKSVRDYGLSTCADRILELYGQLIKHRALRRSADYGAWDRLRSRLEVEWNLLVQKTSALAAAVVATDATRSSLD